MTDQNNNPSSQNSEKRSNKKLWITIAVAVVCAMIFAIALPKMQNNPAAQAKTASAEILKDWTDGSNAKTKLVTFVTEAVNPQSKGYIPVENRIAVFDMDGTLLSETNPYYYEWMMFFHRVLNDPTYQAPAEIKDFVLNVAMPAVYAGKVSDEIDAQFSKYQAQVYDGMTIDDYNNFVHEFMKQPVNGQKGMTYGDSFYIPMREVVEYLQGNDFTVYVVSGADRLTTRATVTQELGVHPNNVIGSDSEIQAGKQGDENGEFYTFTADDKVVRGDDLIIKNLKMNKVSAINREIGIQPVLAFGNSSGDESMLLYTINNNKYPAEAFILLCDDEVRDHGNKEKAASTAKMAEKDGFNTVSMEKDFKTIYGDDVTITDIEKAK